MAHHSSQAMDSIKYLYMESKPDTRSTVCRPNQFIGENIYNREQQNLWNQGGETTSTLSLNYNSINTIYSKLMFRSSCRADREGHVTTNSQGDNQLVVPP